MPVPTSFFMCLLFCVFMGLNYINLFITSDFHFIISITSDFQTSTSAAVASPSATSAAGLSG